MESIEDTEWDAMIVGTGLPQSLLALALSRSDKKILHVDANEYYGGIDAALSLQDADAWAKQVEDHSSISSHISDARITRPPEQAAAEPTAGTEETRGKKATASKLGFSRAYNLALAPQIIYMRSAFLSTLVSSRVFRQLEFMAVGSWFVYNEAEGEAPATTETESSNANSKAIVNSRLRKIPNNREDVFADKSMGIKAKRSLISFQRLFRDPDEQASVIEDNGSRPLKDFLVEQYGLPDSLQEAINALTLSPDPPSKTTVGYALPRIARHVTSMGVSGAGFGAVIPKWGGLAEIAQVACRAQAVGGGVYMLGKGVKSVKKSHGSLTEVTLSDDVTVKTKLVAACSPTELGKETAPNPNDALMSARAISIVAYPFNELFSRLVDDGPKPVVAVVCFPAGSVSSEGVSSPSPVYLMVHSAESGECPNGQCVIYASMTSVNDSRHSQGLLNEATRVLLDVYDQKAEQVLWTLNYDRKAMGQTDESSAEVRLIRDMGLDLTFDDAVLRDVRAAWQKTGQSDGGFMTFEDREVGAYDDEDNDNDES